MWSQRDVIDFGLARRAALEALRGPGPTTREDVCDAHPHLLRAARHHGRPTGRDCPVCRAVRLVELSYAYGEALGRCQGRLRSPAELEAMAHEHDEFRVYTVEACVGCGWNHLVRSFVLGDGVDRRAGAGAATADPGRDEGLEEPPARRRAGMAPGSEG